MYLCHLPPGISEYENTKKYRLCWAVGIFLCTIIDKLFKIGKTAYGRKEVMHIC